MIIQKKTNYQTLLKCLALIAMLLDHCGLYIFHQAEILRVFGRISMPIFCFCAGYNFSKRPKTKIFLLGFGLQVFSIIILERMIVFNILISIFLGQCYINIFFDKSKSIDKMLLHLFFLTILFYYSNLFFDYGTISIIIMFLGRKAKDNKNLKINAAITIIISIIHSSFTFVFPLSYAILNIILQILLYFLIIKIEQDQTLPVLLVKLSQNTIYIYCVHIMLLQLYYRINNI